MQIVSFKLHVPTCIRLALNSALVSFLNRRCIAVAGSYFSRQEKDAMASSVQVDEPVEAIGDEKLAAQLSSRRSASKSQIAVPSPSFQQNGARARAPGMSTGKACTIVDGGAQLLGRPRTNQGAKLAQDHIYIYFSPF